MADKTGAKPKITLRTRRQGEDNPKLRQLFEDGEAMRVDLALVRRDEGQPRSLDSVMEGIEALADNIAAVGMIEVPCYRITDDGSYVIVTGERRTAAARHLGWTDILARVKRFDAEGLRKLRKIQYFENDPRFKKHLTPFEDALFWRKFVDDSFAGSVAEAAEDMGVSAALVHNKLAILKAEPEVAEFIHAHVKDSSAASELVAIHKEDPNVAKQWMDDLVAGNLANVRGSIKLLKKAVSGKKRGGQRPGTAKGEAVPPVAETGTDEQDKFVNRARPVEPAVVTAQGINKVLLDEKRLLSRVALGGHQGLYLGGAFLSVAQGVPFGHALADIAKLDDDAYQLFYQILSLSENGAGQDGLFAPLIKKVSMLLEPKG